MFFFLNLFCFSSFFCCSFWHYCYSFSHYCCSFSCLLLLRFLFVTIPLHVLLFFSCLRLLFYFFNFFCKLQFCFGLVIIHFSYCHSFSHLSLFLYACYCCFSCLLLLFRYMFFHCCSSSCLLLLFKYIILCCYSSPHCYLFMHAIVLLCVMFFFTFAITPFLQLMLFLQYIIPWWYFFFCLLLLFKYILLCCYFSLHCYFYVHISVSQCTQLFLFALVVASFCFRVQVHVPPLLLLFTFVIALLLHCCSLCCSSL